MWEEGSHTIRTLYLTSLHVPLDGGQFSQNTTKVRLIIDDQRGIREPMLNDSMKEERTESIQMGFWENL